MAVLKYARLPFNFNVALLQQEVHALSKQHWKLHYQTKHYEGTWSAIPLRSIEGKEDDIFVSPEQHAHYRDTLYLAACPYLQEVLSNFNCTLLSVRLLNLAAGAFIKEHRDADLAFEKGEIRVHIPVQTNNEVEFILDGENICLKEGECWYMNFNLHHSINNKSNKDRIHLVIDAEVNDWVTEILQQPGLLKKETEASEMDDGTKRRIIESLREMHSETGNRLADEMEASLST
jgi:hypothetical protein